MDMISLKMPFIVLSSRENHPEEFEKRVLTPFGVIDVTFRKTTTLLTQEPSFEIEVNGDTDHWIFDDSAIGEFRKALLHFLWQIVERMENKVLIDSDDLYVSIGGNKIRL